MIVKELIEQLSHFNSDLPVVICDLRDDGNGDGAQYLPEINNIEEDFVLKNGKKTSAVFIIHSKQ